MYCAAKYKGMSKPTRLMRIPLWSCGYSTVQDLCDVGLILGHGNLSPIRTDCVTIFLNVVARGGTVRWNRHITPDLCLATLWLHDLIYVRLYPKVHSNLLSVPVIAVTLSCLY
jgi:hypothetical protein